MENYYELLNISPSASKEELEKAILQQQRLWHSQINSADFERRFRAETMLRKLDKIQDALLDDEKRKAYNKSLFTLSISNDRPETRELNKKIDSMPKENGEPLEEKERSIERLERLGFTQNSDISQDLKSPYQSVIRTLAKDDDKFQDEQRDSIRGVEWIFVLGASLGISSFLTELAIFLMTSETEEFPILILFPCIAGLVGAVMVRSNAQIGGYIMTIAGIVHLFAATSIILGAIFGISLLIVGLRSVFRTV